ncbi:Lipase class 3 protein [Heracleum sosnowskyi]|uniref:Lipase class 3 protein n=1 Tax=Heracleum sosnowskyi TaxID=360622 RepID=A0AAD8HAF3_9APIA|nr:Lipase class 3 protein [Heracleum sosnowskyi]
MMILFRTKCIEVSNKLIRPPVTWLETISTLSETLIFTYSETLGKWPIGELAFGISFLLKQQGNLQVHSVFGGEDSVQLKGDEITSELRYFLHLLTLCCHFSKKPFPLFLEETGFSQENVLLQEPKSGVTASAWVNDLKSQNIECTRILSTVYRSASALGSRLPSLASARARVAGAGAILHPVSTGTQVVMKRAQTMARGAWSHPSIELSSWSCMGPRRRPTTTRTHLNVGEYSLESSSGKSETFEPLIISPLKSITAIELPVSSEANFWSSQVECSSSNELGLNCETDVDYSDDLVGPGPLPQGEGDDLAKEMREEEAEAICKMSERDRATSLLNTREVHRFLPPGKIMHIVTLVGDELEDESDSRTFTDRKRQRLAFFLPQDHCMYSKLRLS